MPKVVFCNRFYYPDSSATSQILSALARALAASGHDVHIVTSRLRYQTTTADLAPFESVNGVNVHRVRTSAFGGNSLIGKMLDYASFYVGAAYRLARLVAPGDTVVAKTDPPMIGVVANLICRRKGATLINWLQDLFPEIARAAGIQLPGAAYRLLFSMRNATLRAAHCNVVIGRCMDAHVRAIENGSINTALIPNWAEDAAAERNDGLRNSLRQEWALEQKLIVGYSGNLGRVHQVDVFADAIDILTHTTDVRFLFIGGGVSMAALEQRVGSSATFVPYQPLEHLGASLTVPDVHVVCLDPEHTGLVVPSKYYGVLAAGRPCIFVGSEASEVGASVLQHGVGMVVADAETLAAAVLQLQENAEMRCEMGRRARALYESEATLARGVERWRKVLDAP